MEILYKHLNGDIHYKKINTTNLYLNQNLLRNTIIIYVILLINMIELAITLEISVLMLIAATTLFMGLMYGSIKVSYKKRGFVCNKGYAKVILRKQGAIEILDGVLIGYIKKIKEVEVSEKYIKLYKKDYLFISIPLRVLNGQQKLELINLLNINDNVKRDYILSYEV